MLNLNILNKSQKKAVTTINGPILCIAGAGSGKTTALTYRVANLIENGVSPASILLLTFTKKAASEMLSRVNSLVGIQGNEVEGGTFHHFAASILSRYGSKLGINRNFVVIGDNDSADIIHSLKQSNYAQLKDFTLPSKKSINFQIISKARNSNLNFEQVINQDYGNLNISPQGIEYLYSEYNKYKKNNNLLDYDDLLEYLYNLLQIPEYQILLSEQYKYVMVDEYQDTNIIQARITYLLSEKNQNIMVVGDDAQSIYSFRGGRVENIKDFSKKFPNAQIIKLEQNYRSFGYILNGCNNLIKHSQECIQKKLFTDKIAGNKIAIVKCISEKEEASLIASRILQLYKAGYILKNQAVLFRNSNYSYELEMELAKRCIPFRKIGGPKVFDSDHIRDIISYLRILNNPYEKMSWLRVLMLINRIGIETATSIYEQIKNQLEPFEFSHLKIKKEIKTELSTLSNMLLSCVKNINKSPSEILNFIIDYYIPILKQKDPESYNQKIKDLDQITLIASKYSNLHNFLSELFIDKNDENNNTVDAQNDYITLSTIHSAKGLEWKQVFIISALEGRFPSFSSSKHNVNIEEERRLMYVAMTRAMEGLTLSFPSGIWDKTSREFLVKPSRFISEISSEDVEIWNIKR